MKLALSEIYKKSNSVFCTGVAEKYALIEQWRQQFPIEAMCQVFGVSRAVITTGYSMNPQTENKVMSG